MPLADYRKLRAFLNDEPLDLMHINWFVINVIAQTALRVGEATALKEDDIDFEHLTLRGDESYDSMRRTLKTTKSELIERFRLVQTWLRSLDDGLCIIGKSYLSEGLATLIDY